MKILGVIAPYLMGTYPGALVAALHARARQIGAALLLLRTASQDSSYALNIGIERADAWITIVNPASPDLLRRICSSGRPVCVIGHDYGLAELGSVRADNHAGIFAAMRHLYEKGHRRFAFTGPLNMTDCLERRDAVLDFAGQHPECARPVVLEAADFSYSAGYESAEALLASDVAVSAVIAATDNNALGVIAALRDRGIRVPEDVAVVGFDNSIFARSSGGGITTLDQKLDQLAALAFDDVQARLCDPDRAPVRQRVAPTLILRASTGDVDTATKAQLVEREVAQSFIAVSEEVGQLSGGGRAVYLRDYLKRLGFRLRFASVARLVAHEQAALILTALPEGGPAAANSLLGAQIPLALFPPIPESLYLDAGDFIAVLLQSGVEQGTQLMSLCFRGSDLDKSFALETLTHEIELLCYQLHVQLMGDDLNRALESLRATQGELLRSEKQAALGIAVAGVAHELNTPLGNCLLSVSTLSDIATTTRRKYEGGALKRTEVEEMLTTTEGAAQILQRNIGVALRLVGDFKQLRVEHEEVRPDIVALAVYLGDMIAVLRVRARQQRAIITCETHDVGLDARFETCPQLLSQVINELVENALIHGVGARDDGEVRIFAEHGENGVSISVADNGAGIDSDVLDRVFDPFFTTRMGASSGLGLAMVHNLVTGPLKGKIHAKKGSLGGACFVIELPLKL